MWRLQRRTRVQRVFAAPHPPRGLARLKLGTELVWAGRRHFAGRRGRHNACQDAAEGCRGRAQHQLRESIDPRGSSSAQQQLRESNSPSGSSSALRPRGREKESRSERATVRFLLRVIKRKKNYSQQNSMEILWCSLFHVTPQI